MSRNTAAVVIAGMICVTVLLFGIFIWPTPYLYVTETDALRNQNTYKITRLTGSAERIHYRAP